MVKSSKERDYVLQKLVDERKNIDVLLLQQIADPGYYTDEIIKGIIATVLTARTDTWSLTMEWEMSLLLNHPESMKKAKDEIDLNVGKECFLEESELPNLPYLNNIINKTQLYPIGPVVTHESSKDCTVRGFQVPSNTMLHRDQNVWVKPLKFNPERFEGIENVNDGFKFIPFGSGRSRCPASEGLATRMVVITLGSLIQCFKWKRIVEEMVDMREATGLILPSGQTIRCYVQLMYDHWKDYKNIY